MNTSQYHRQVIFTSLKYPIDRLLRTLTRYKYARNMKTMTCQQLGGACSQTFSANSFDEIASMVSKHAREMVQQGDAAHIAAMNEMRSSMTSPDAMNAWMDEKRKAFNALKDNG
jgi:predicted small metal-binding protein